MWSSLLAPTVARYGSWKSPISASLLTATGVSLIQPRPGRAGEIYWIEGRPSEAGRCVVVRRCADGTIEDLLPPPFNARTRAHEYGGGSMHVDEDTVYFTDFSEQRLYRLCQGGAPEPLTADPSTPGSVRFADFETTDDHQWLIAIRETHGEGEAVNDVVALRTDGSSEPVCLASGHDFFSNPRLSPDGRQLVWVSWDHPNMPWDGGQLWVADRLGDFEIGPPRLVAGGDQESIFQPEWSPDGILHFVSDRSGWWNLYAELDGQVVPLAPKSAEFGVPQWVFGMRRYAFLPDGRLAAAYGEGGVDRLGIVTSGGIDCLDLPYTAYGTDVHAGGDGLLLIAGKPDAPSELVTVNVDSGESTVVRRSLEIDLESEHVSPPQSIEFPTSRNRTAHAIFFPPANKDFVAPEDERPPLLVISHGGPTGSASAEFSAKVQYWTSRGFAVVDVDYSGSTGYGREYRERLRGEWGIVDTDDCINAARYLVDRDLVDGERLAIRGGSAGGYTTLCALVFHDVFAAGASYYGVADLAGLSEDTHKFESRYLDGLVGPYPEAEATYRERSPIHFAEQLSCPVILLQGLEDKVVPPSQAEVMVEAMEAKGLSHAYIAFQGEQHGFRQAVNVQRALEAELYFYSEVFGFGLAEEIEPVDIKNFPPS